MSLNLEPITEALKDRAREAAKELLNGTVNDIETFSNIMSIDLTEAVAAGDTEAVLEIGAQARALGEKHRIYASRQVWATFNSILVGGAQFMIVALRASMGSI